MQFKEKIVRERSDRNWTQRKMADFIGVSLRSLAGWESGESIPPRNKRRQICIKLQLPDDFFEEERCNFSSVKDEGKLCEDEAKYICEQKNDENLLVEAVRRLVDLIELESKNSVLSFVNLQEQILSKPVLSKYDHLTLKEAARRIRAATEKNPD